MTNTTATATLHTTQGDIRVNLYGLHAPKTVRNFIGLATGEQSWRDPRTNDEQTGPLYQDLVFHRIIPNFMIQGGDPLGTGTGGPGYEFDDEISPDLDFTKPYMLAMANAGKRGGRGTNGSQFFITTGATTWLQGAHTIFGEVADDESRAVVDKLGSVPTDRSDRPVEKQVLKSITIDGA
ncbi:MAG: peptidyl-prolyl cis-trans isomerase [Pseudonocardiales bacterium]|jgi:peptidyl-prolyl cis-trans isomerase A (cyclophilin A)|nr:peptidyl-prolyl cis-trans isomerase [Microbacteriaceae bacterium]MDQ1739027.1 peptidyl-prolyl cis-trans isomerase [Pseudonocardiales bacterium]